MHDVKKVYTKLIESGINKEKALDVIVRSVVSVHSSEVEEGKYFTAFYNENNSIIFEVETEYDDENELLDSFYDSLYDYYEETLS